MDREQLEKKIKIAIDICNAWPKDTMTNDEVSAVIELVRRLEYALTLDDDEFCNFYYELWVVLETFEDSIKWLGFEGKIK